MASIPSKRFSPTLRFSEYCARESTAAPTIKEAARYMEEGHFPPGSMQPKIQAAIEFLRSNGKQAVITSIEAIESAVQGLAGTEIIR